MSQQDAANTRAEYKTMLAACIDQIHVRGTIGTNAGAKASVPAHFVQLAGEKSADGTSLPSDLPSSIQIVASTDVPKNTIILMKAGVEVGRVIRVA